MYKKRKKKKTKSPYKKAVALCDVWFSRYIRISSSDKEGICTCCTCGLKREWKYIDCGHFIPRQYKATRWMKQNCNAQCKKCNGFEGGRMDLHRDFIIKQDGQDAMNYIMFKHQSEKRSAVKYYEFELIEMARIYKELAVGESIQRGIKLK